MENTDFSAQIKLLLKLGRFDTAKKLVDNELQKQENLAFYYNLRALISHRQSNFKQAIQDFRKALNLDPDYTECALNLVVTYADMGMYDEAGVLYEKTTSNKKNPGGQLHRSHLAKFHYDLANKYLRSNLVSEAIGEFKKCLGLKSDYSKARVALAKIHISNKNFKKARIELETALKSDMNCSEARTWLGVALSKLGNTQAAQLQWQKVYAQDPKYKPAMALQEMMNQSGIGHGL